MPNKVGGRPYHYLSMAAKGAREAPFFVAAQRIGVEHFDVATSGDGMDSSSQGRHRVP